MMNSDLIRFIVSSLLISFISMHSQPLHALSTEDDGSVTEVATLDLFDEDAERTRQGWLQFSVSVGAMILDGDGKFSARLPGGNEVTIIDFDRAGLKETDSSYWLSLDWRSANSRWGAWFNTWAYDVSGSRIWEYSLIIGEDEIPVGASVTSDFDAKWYILEATYSFYRSESIDTGIGFGFHMVDLDTTINAKFWVGDQEVQVVSSRLDTLAPLPNVLVYFHWKFSPRWNVTTRVGYFGLDYDDYSGRMTNAHVMLNYQLSQRWALDLGYQFIDLDLEVEKKNFTQVYNFEFSGPMAFARFSF